MTGIGGDGTPENHDRAVARICVIRALFSPSGHRDETFGNRLFFTRLFSNEVTATNLEA